jgi:single-strand DNA-binding protein
MPRGFNRVIVMGNLTKDPEVRYTVDKRAWARFSVAVNYTRKNKNGEFQEGVDFIPVTAWGTLGERCGRYLKKGSGVLVEGKIKTSTYEARDGSGKRYSTDVWADDVQFVGPKPTSDGEEFRPVRAAPVRAPTPPAPGPQPFGDDADFGKSMREKGFGDEFPMDFSEMGDTEEGEAEIPF